MLVKWKTVRPWRGAEIERVECERESDKSVWVVEPLWRIQGKQETIVKKRAKNSDFDNYHDSWEEAREFLLERANRIVEVARQELKNANDQLGNIKGLKKPSMAAPLPEPVSTASGL